MKVYACPIPEPVVDYANFDRKKVAEAEDEHTAKLKAHLIKMGYSGKRTGEILSVSHADSAALYMYAAVPANARKGTRDCLIHLPYGDAWDSPLVHGLTKKAVIALIESEKKIAKLVPRW